jgi:hypothetical protein
MGNALIGYIQYRRPARLSTLQFGVGLIYNSNICGQGFATAAGRNSRLTEHKISARRSVIQGIF